MGTCSLSKELYHWQYKAMIPTWEKIRDCFAGEEQIKCQGDCYLPKTPGMINGTNGQTLYDNYVMRAIFYQYPADIALRMFGLLNKEQAEFIVNNDRLKRFVDNMDGNGNDAQAIIEDIHSAQLSIGRVGYLLDSTDEVGTDIIPHAVRYVAETIVDWDFIFVDGKIKLTLVVLNESGKKRDESGKWQDVEQYRVCRLTNEVVEDGVITQVGGTYYNYTIEKLEDLDLSEEPAERNEPMISGKKLDVIPFVFCNVSDTKPCIGKPVSEPICDLSLSLYRNSADYMQTLHEQGQETLVGIGLAKDDLNRKVQVGTGAFLASTSPDGDYKYIGISGESLSEMREAQDDLHEKIQERGVVLTDGSKESGEALSIRMTAKTSVLTQIANTSARAMLEMLTLAAEWMNIDDKEIEVNPNLDFADSNQPVKDILDLVTSKLQGNKLSWRSIHTVMQKRGLTELTFEEEEEEIENEPVIPIGGGVNEEIS